MRLYLRSVFFVFSFFGSPALFFRGLLFGLCGLPLLFEFRLVLGLFLFVGKALLFAPCFEFGLPCFLGKAVVLFLFEAEPLFGLYPLYACGLCLSLLAGKYGLSVGREMFSTPKSSTVIAQSAYAPVSIQM